jgi:PleD family two-component response regulator
MPEMMTYSKMPFGEPLQSPSILLASDSESRGLMIQQTLAGEGFLIQYAGHYAQLDSSMENERFDIVLLEVTGEHAVESAVDTALRVKRANPGQFVGYLADPALDASGLAGDAVFPRNPAKLPDRLRAFLSQTDIRSS